MISRRKLIIAAPAILLYPRKSLARFQQNNLIGFGAFPGDSNLGNSWSVDFDGSTQYGTTTSSGLAAPISGLGWFYFDTIGTQHCLFNFGTSDSQTTETRLEIVDSGGALTFHDPGLVQTLTAAGVAATGAWMMLGFAWSGAALSSTQPAYYKNGSAASYASTSGAGTPAINATNFNLAKTGSGLMDGKCAMMALWSSELSAAEVAEIYAGGPGMVLSANSGDYVSAATLKHHYAIEEGSGTTFTDQKAAANMSLTGTPTWSSSVP